MKAYHVPNALVHPFDLDRFQIDVHKVKNKKPTLI